MGYSGARLSLAVHEVIAPTRHAGRELADKAGATMTHRVRELTPVDTGQLKGSWRQKPVVLVASMEGHIVWESGCETDKDYAPYVEHGTGLWGPKHAKYPIRPKKPGGWLHWIGKDGEDVFAKLVMHPGSRGRHMVAIAVGATLAELHTIAGPVLLEWKFAAEAAFLRGGGRHARLGSLGRSRPHV